MGGNPLIVFLSSEFFLVPHPDFHVINNSLELMYTCAAVVNIVVVNITPSQYRRKNTPTAHTDMDE